MATGAVLPVLALLTGPRLRAIDRMTAAPESTDLLRRVPGVRVQPEGRNGTAVLLRSKACSPIVFVDGYASSIGSFTLMASTV
mgnify:CR=1 FL=1